MSLKHFKKLYQIAKKDGINSALKYDLKETSKHLQKRGLLRYTALFLIGLGAGFGIDKAFGPKQSYEFYDVNGDGVEDIVLRDKSQKDLPEFLLIKNSDGSYDRANLVISDGIPFYKTEKGFYDPWGHYFGE